MNGAPKMNPIRAFGRAFALIFMIVAPVWVLAPLFGVMVGQSRQFGQPQPIKHVIFDLGGVLVLEPTKTKGLRQIGLLRLLRYWLSGSGKLSKLKKKYINFLHRVKPLSPGRPQALTQDGSQLLPELLHESMTNERSSEEILQEIELFLANDTTLGKSEKTLMHAIALMNFTPETLAKIMRPSKKGIEFVKHCKSAGLNVYILSNFETETYEKIQKRYPELFDLFEEENTFVSGYLGVVKPDARIYEVILDAHNLDSATCVFIDDQKENIAAAEACGINGIWCPKKKGLFGSSPNIELVAQELENMGVESIETVQA